MPLKFVSNGSNDWAPMPDLGSNLHPEWAAVWPPDKDPPPRTATGARPATHELRPWERYYYVEGDRLPLPPPPEDSRWDSIRTFFWNTINRGRSLDARHEIWVSDTWKDRAEGDDERYSAGSWARDYAKNRWFEWDDGSKRNGGWAYELPNYRRVGYEGWANGHPAGNHYASASHALEEFMRTWDPMSWQLFVLRTLHFAGQGIYHKDGSGRYEKSAWCFAGDSHVDGYHQWSHHWPECVWLFNLLTGELPGVALKTAEYVEANDDGWSGSWGIRGAARYLRALRAIDHCYPGLTVDDERAMRRIESVLDHVEGRGEEYFLNLGKLWDEQGNIDVWQAWDWMYEAGAWALVKGWDDIYKRILPLANWQLNNTMRADGMMAYYAGRANTSGSGHAPVYTSHALPFMGIMVYRGDLDRQTLRNSANNVLNYLPIDGSDPGGRGRGMIGVRDNGTVTFGWGGAAHKMAAQITGGLRPDTLEMAGF